jgi:hypothetical protein
MDGSHSTQNNLRKNIYIGKSVGTTINIINTKIGILVSNVMKLTICPSKKPLKDER